MSKNTETRVPMKLTAIVIADYDENGVELIFNNSEKCVAHLFYNKSDVTIAGTNSVSVKSQFSCETFTEDKRYMGIFKNNELIDITSIW